MLCHNRVMKQPSRPLFAFTLVVGLVLGACGSDEMSESTQTTGSDSTEEVNVPTDIPQALMECGDPLSDAQGYQLIDADLAEASWELPEGWELTTQYEEDKPVEIIDDLWVVQPVDNPVSLNVLAVVTYSGLDWSEFSDDCGRVPVDAIEEQLKGYNEQIGAEILKEAEFTELGGQPAITQDVSIEVDSSVDSYSYTGVWLFSRSHLLHAYCQWTTQEELVRQGCSELLDSIQVPETSTEG